MSVYLHPNIPVAAARLYLRLCAQVDIRTIPDTAIEYIEAALAEARAEAWAQGFEAAKAVVIALKDK
jgi:hypothetical protein